MSCIDRVYLLQTINIHKFSSLHELWGCRQGRHPASPARVSPNPCIAYPLAWRLLNHERSRFEFEDKTFLVRSALAGS